MSLVSSLSIAQQALSINQAAITVISNNIANVDNENYSKLRVELADVINYNTLTDTISQANSLNGVQISKIQRYSDAYLQNYYWTENSSYNYLDKYSTVASNVESIINELNDTGLSSALSDFYDAIDSLNADPTSESARENYVSCAKNICSIFNNYYGSLSNMKENLVGDYQTADSVDDSEIGNEVNSLNSLFNQLADVNGSIIKANASGIAANSLLDERDSLITKISEYSNVNVTIGANQSASVSIGNYKFVSSSGVVGYLDATTGTASEPAKINVVDANGDTLYSDINDSITGGSIGAILDICGDDIDNFTINGVIEQLNNLALGFANIMNDIQNGDPEDDDTTALCLNSAGTKLITATEDIFINNETGVADSDINAGNITVNSTIINDSNLIAAARLDLSVYTLASQYENDTGNNTNTTLMSESRTNTYSTSSYTPSTVDFGGQTIEGYLSTLASKTGYSVENINSSLTTQSTVLNGISSQLESKTGVNLDEELSDLIKFQRAYEASARVFSTCNQLLEELINLGR